ncbi:MAG TPA: sigma-54 dependent transcriptional regulator [Candidatus Krumholzibacteria bacterium]|jgi:DNA-binding NtrC family response regulator
MSKKHTVLICDDQDNIRSSLKEALHNEGHTALEAPDGETAVKLVGSSMPDLLLLDLKLPDMTGIEVLRQLRAAGHSVPVILMTAYGDLPTAVEAMKLGAYDFVQKPYSLGEMKAKVNAALKVRDRERASDRLTRSAPDISGGHYLNLLRNTPGLADVVEKIEKVGRSRAGNEVSVLIQGESGCGKELVSRAIHEVSHPGAPFMEINCAAVPDTLLESELFGHEKGAFTDAKAAKEGLFELAGKGTIFLDEIGEMGVTLQSRLLRVIENRRFRRVGGKSDKEVRARIIAATNRELQKAIEEGVFRNDLYYRLQVIEIEIPPLRERTDDIPELARSFVEIYNGELGFSCAAPSESLCEILQTYPWPGNVRELKNMVRRILILEEPSEILPEHLPAHVRRGENPRGAMAGGVERIGRELLPLAEVERLHLLHVLDATGNNKSKAARILGISRQTLREKLKSYQSAAVAEVAKEERAEA